MLLNSMIHEGEWRSSPSRLSYLLNTFLCRASLCVFDSTCRPYLPTQAGLIAGEAVLAPFLYFAWFINQSSHLFAIKWRMLGDSTYLHQGLTLGLAVDDLRHLLLNLSCLLSIRNGVCVDFGTEGLGVPVCAHMPIEARNSGETWRHVPSGCHAARALTHWNADCGFELPGQSD